MKKLTYSLLYTPSINTNYDAKYICADDRVHIRFKDFYKPQVIFGFESKLSYLLTYLYYFGDYEDLKDFLNSKDVEVLNTVIYKCILQYTGYKYKGLHLLLPNNKKEVDLECFPENNVKEKSKIKCFLNGFKIKLEDYLFNDSYYIRIHLKPKQKDNKFIRKKQRIKEKESELIELW